MHIELSESTISWQKKARDYADEYLQPFEVEAELNGGVLPSEIVSKQKTRAIKLGFSAIDVPRSHGGLELPMVEQVAIWEQLGRVTNALSWCFSEPQSWMFEACSDEQIETYVLPMMRGEKYVTSANLADFFWLQAQLPDEGDDALFLVERDTDGIEMIASPLFNHT